MARKEGLEMKSYPLIASLKEQLRAEVLRRGGGYWDLYDVMGGEGSMVQWVEHRPAWAVKDYIHFTPKRRLQSRLCFGSCTQRIRNGIPRSHGSSLLLKSSVYRIAQLPLK